MAAIIASNYDTSFTLSNGDILYVPREVNVLGPSGMAAIDTPGDAQGLAITIDGAVISPDWVSVILGGESATGNNLTVGATGIVRSATSDAIIIFGEENVFRNWGQITGQTGIYLGVYDGGIFENHGIISGDNYSDYGVIRAGVDLCDCWFAPIVNTGLITGGYGVSINNSLAKIQNSGEIIATAPDRGWDDAAIYGERADEKVEVVNSGRIASFVAGIVTADEDDTIVNSGVIEGMVKLAGGDDLYQGQGDGVVLASISRSNGVLGEAGNDILTGASGSDYLDGGQDNDRLKGRGGDDLLYGGDGLDQVHGGAGDDRLYGGAQDDTLSGGAGDDVIEGGAGDDEAWGQNGDDQIDGGDGADILRGGRGDDVIHGGALSDTLFGGEGDDVLTGGAGYDYLHGRAGNDALTGGGGVDRFIFHRQAGFDDIKDFSDGVDLIVLKDFGLGPNGFANTLAPALSDANGATLLDLTALGGEGSVLIQGLAFADADASDFVL